MASASVTALAQIAAFANQAAPPAEARSRASNAILDTIGVALAGSIEPAARIVRGALEPPDARTLGLWDRRTSDPSTAVPRALVPSGARHTTSRRRTRRSRTAPRPTRSTSTTCASSRSRIPSAPLVPAIIAAGEMVGASGRAVLDAYVVGFEIQARLGRLMNPRHYQRGWHCTSTLGVMSAAAGAGRLLGPTKRRSLTRSPSPPRLPPA
jgi:2-methylcitrate dehydratase PrpD